MIRRRSSVSALCPVQLRSLKSAEMMTRRAAGVPDVDIAMTTRELGPYDQARRHRV